MVYLLCSCSMANETSTLLNGPVKVGFPMSIITAHTTTYYLLVLLDNFILPINLLDEM